MLIVSYKMFCEPKFVISKKRKKELNTFFLVQLQVSR